jgi:hypothetical protein
LPFVSDLSENELALDALKAVMGVLAYSSFDAKRAAAASTLGKLTLHSDNKVVGALYKVKYYLGY